MPEQDVLQTLDRGLVALRAVADSEEGLRISEIATHLGTHRAIAYRIVNTLAGQGMVRRLPGGQIILGSGAMLLGMRAEGALRALARPTIESLAQSVEATAFLSVAMGEEGVAILTAEPRNAFLNINYRVGTRHPLTRGAAGIAILAGRPAKANDPPQVVEAREKGFSITSGELQRGAVGVAAPVSVPECDYRKLECSIGIVGLEGFDVMRAAGHVCDTANALADILCCARS